MAGQWELEEGEPPPREARRGWVLEEAPKPTAPTRAIPQRQAEVVAPPQTNLAQSIVRFFTGDGQRQPGVGEAAYQQVPIRTPADPARPETWLDDFGRSAAVGLGFFLNPNEKARAQIIQRQIPTAQFRRDEYGNMQVRYDAARPWAYINRPGASAEDLQTFANEIGKYLVVRRFTGGAGSPSVAPAPSPLATSTLVEAGRGAVQSVLGQAASMPLGAEEVNAGDVVVSAGGAAAGNVAGHLVTSAARNAPGLMRDTIRAIDERLPGGSTRLAERQALAQTAQANAEQVARAHAEATVRAGADQLKLQGEALERAVADAQEKAAATVRAQFEAPAAGSEARALDKLAKAFGVRLAKAQTEGDAAGMQFLYEAAGGMHGAGAQRQAAAFLSAQNEALPQAIRSIAGDLSITSPQAAVSVAREGVMRARDALKADESAAWKAFDDAAENIRTYDKTPVLPDGRGGNPGAVTTVRQRLQQTLLEDRKMVRPTNPETGDKLPATMLPEFRETYPRVARVMALTDRMATSTKNEVPINDVRRVLELKRFIDSEWESADTDAERRILTMLGKEVRNWLKEPGGGYGAIAEDGAIAGGRAARGMNARGASVTHERLTEALAISERSAKTFRESDFMVRLLDERAPMTDQELTTRLFGGGEGGLNVSSDSLRAMQAMKEALGPASPEWDALRQAALQRLTRGLDDAIATNQTPAILTTFKRIEEAFRRNREAMTVLFTPDELARLREAQRVVAAMAPTPRNPANPTNSGITAARATKGALTALGDMLKNVPAANYAVGGVSDLASAARVNMEIGGASQPGFNLARRIASALWDVQPGGPGAPVGAAYGTVAAQDPTYPPR